MTDKEREEKKKQETERERERRCGVGRCTGQRRWWVKRERERETHTERVSVCVETVWRQRMWCADAGVYIYYKSSARIIMIRSTKTKRQKTACIVDVWGP